MSMRASKPKIAGGILGRGIATELRDFRKLTDLTQEQMAERLGVSDRTYQQWEYGTASSKAVIIHLALCELKRRMGIPSD